MGLEAFADLVASRLLAVGGQAVLLAALVWALCRFLPRLDARTRAWLWWLVATQMVVGLFWYAPVGLPLLPAAPSAAVAVQAVPMTIDVAASAVPASTTATALQPAVAQDAGLQIGWPVWLLAAWLAGVAVMLLNTARHGLRLRGQLARATPCTDPRANAEYAALGRHLGLDTLPALRVSDEIESPMLAGPWRPVLLLPAAGLARMRGDDLRMALHHELAHLQRRDLWWAWMPALAQHLFFFHPVAHLAAREYGLAREVACDAAVLADERHAPHDYGRLLVKLGVATAPSPALAGASPTFRILKRRLLMLQHTASPLRSGALALTIGLVLLGAVPYQVTASAPKAPVAASPAAAATNATAPVAATAATAATPAAAPVAATAATPAARPAAAPRAVVTARGDDVPAPPPPPPVPAPPAVPKVAPPAPPAPPKYPGHSSTTSTRSTQVINIDREGGGDAYVLIDGNEVTMAGRSDDIVTARKQQQGNAPVLWVRQDGKQYVVRDTATLKQVKAAHAPMEALGAQQGKLGEEQGALGERQGALGEKQGELGVKMAAIATEQASAAMRGEQGRQVEFDRKMDALAREQDALAKRQEALARQQEPLARQQEALARQQAAAVMRMQSDVDRLVGEAIRTGKAQRL
ncbi:MAG: M56 family metallopeptidase [Pseudoxanthomonas sp.]